MKKSVIHKFDLKDEIRNAIILKAAYIAFSLTALDRGKAVYESANACADEIVDQLTKRYTVIRKSKTERTV